MTEISNKPEKSKLLESAGEFILALLQAFLRTGYYLPDHPEAHKAKAGLYDKFYALVTGTEGELTFMTGEYHGKQIMLFEGISDKPLRLSDIMQRGIAETYTLHFIKFFERKEIVSLSLSGRMDAEEFSQFVDIMSEPLYVSMEGNSTKERFVHSLKSRRICNISFVFSEEFITSRPDVPWRARMALSRLKKDIHLLPILRSLKTDELHEVKLQILTDIIRPLGVADLIYALLINLDMASSQFLSEEEAENSLFRLINDKLLIPVGHLLIAAAMATDVGFPAHITPEKKGRLLAGLCQRLNISKDVRAGTMLETLFNKGLVSLEALPAAVKNRISTIKRLTTFLMKPDSFLDSIDKTTEPDVYMFRVHTIISFVPLLVERGKIHEAISIVELINRHAQEKSGRSACAIQKRTELVFGETLDLASKLFLSATKEVRTLIGRLFQLSGNASIPHLQRILIESDDQWRSKQAAESLVSMGDKAVASLITAIESTIFSKVSIPPVLRTLSELSENGLKKDIVRLLLKHARSKHDDTRREALAGLCRTSPASGFSDFSVRLADPELRIRKIAVRGIGLAGDRRGFELLTAIIEKAEKTSWPEDQELAAVAIESLGNLMESCRAAHSAIITYLTLLVDRYSISTWKNIITKAFVPPASIILALTETLGKLHGPTIRTLLVKLSHHKNNEAAKRATELLNKPSSGGELG